MAVTSKKWRPPKRLFFWLVPLIVIITAVGLFGYHVYSRPLPVLRPTLVVRSQPAANNVVPVPDIIWSPHGEQVITVAGTGLRASNTDGQGVFPTASTAKVMLALLILQKKPLAAGQQGPNVPVTAADVAQYEQELAINESVVAVAAGEQLSEYQALEAVLVPSSTNVADMLAQWQFGSISAYAAAANQMAASLGMTQTHFADASGFAPGTVSSASDLVKLGQVALQNPVIADIVGKKSVDLPAAGTLDNFNIVLGQSGITGIKTGNTDQAGGVFLFSAPYLGHTLVGATTHAPDLGTALHDAPLILDSFKSKLQTDTPVKKGQVIARYKLPWGGTVDAVAQKDLATLDWHGSKLAIQTTMKPIKATQSHTQPVGTASITLGTTTQTTPVTLAKTIPQPTFWWRLLHNR